MRISKEQIRKLVSTVVKEQLEHNPSDPRIQRFEQILGELVDLLIEARLLAKEIDYELGMKSRIWFNAISKAIGSDSLYKPFISFTMEDCLQDMKNKTDSE